MWRRTFKLHVNLETVAGFVKETVYGRVFDLRWGHVPCGVEHRRTPLVFLRGRGLSISDLRFYFIVTALVKLEQIVAGLLHRFLNNFNRLKWGHSWLLKHFARSWAHVDLIIVNVINNHIGYIRKTLIAYLRGLSIAILALNPVSSIPPLSTWGSLTFLSTYQ